LVFFCLKSVLYFAKQRNSAKFDYDENLFESITQHFFEWLKIAIITK